MKCVNCNCKLHKNDPICPNCAFDMSFYLQEQAEAPKPSLGRRIVVGILVVLLLCSGATAALFLSGALTPAKVTVAAALHATALQLEEERADLVQGLPALSYLNQLDQGQSTLTLSSTLPQAAGTLSFTMDGATSQYIIKGSTSDDTLLAATGYLSPQSAILHLEESDNAIGLSLATLPQDLALSAFAPLFDVDAISAGYRSDMVENIDQMDEELTRILTNALVSLSTEWDAEKVGGETLDLNGTTIDTTAYTLLFDQAVIRAAAQGAVAEFSASPVFSPYLALLAHQGEMTPDALHQALSEAIDGLLAEMIPLDQCEFTINVYDGRVVLLTAQQAEGRYALILNPEGELFSYMAVASRDEFGISPYLSTSITAENGAYTASCTLLGEEYAIRYFTRDVSDNLIFAQGDTPLLVCSVDTTTADALTFTLPMAEGYVMAESSLTTLEPDWFAPPTYTDLFSMSQTDLMLLVMAMSF